jgi:GTP-binding protein LepA
MANFFLALDANLAIVPILNKIDLPHANVEKTVKEMHTAFGIREEESLLVSARTGQGIDDIIPAIIDRIPPPKGDKNKPLKVFLFDSWYDRFRYDIKYIKLTSL